MLVDDLAISVNIVGGIGSWGILKPCLRPALRACGPGTDPKTPESRKYQKIRIPPPWVGPPKYEKYGNGPKMANFEFFRYVFGAFFSYFSHFRDSGGLGSLPRLQLASPATLLIDELESNSRWLRQASMGATCHETREDALELWRVTLDEVKFFILFHCIARLALLAEICGEPVQLME